MLYAGLDLSRKRLDVCLLDADGALISELATPPDPDGLRSLVERLRPLGPVRAAIESMNGHYRYLVGDDFLPADQLREVETISRLVNAFFRWKFNSCEVIVKGGEAYPIDYANASPDMALVSLHYYFPWAIQALAAWCMFCTATDRSIGVYQRTRDYFEIGSARASRRTRDRCHPSAN